MSPRCFIMAALLAISTQDDVTVPSETGFRPRPMVTIPPPTININATLPVSAIGGDVAFSVKKAANLTLSLPATVRFQEVVTNAGEAWHQNSSEFVVPVDGGYFLTFNAVGGNSSDFTMALMKNKVPQVNAYGTLSHFEHASNSAFLELHRGDVVYLELQEGMIYDHPFNETYTTFTGFLVYHI
nr:complement C1q-like protein 4 [Procambarus clarkii]